TAPGPGYCVAASTSLATLLTSRAEWICRFITPVTPAPTDCGDTAARKASARFNAVSEPTVLPGRCAPTITTGLLVATTRWRNQAVSSNVPVPWAMTAPTIS